MTSKAKQINMLCVILIHTSVKLVTWANCSIRRRCLILIHTSVKLVTQEAEALAKEHFILIHTSVKLVTKFPPVKLFVAVQF